MHPHRVTKRRAAGVCVLLAALASPCAGAGEPASAVVRLSEPVQTTADSETFGAKIDEDARGVRLREVMDDADRYLSEPLLVSTRVAKVCQKKGCFFIAQDGPTVVRVSFKDYGFFVPTDIGGKEVTLAGELVRREVSAEDAAHYRADLGDDEGGAVKSGDVYEIVASAVRVPR